MTTEGWQVDPQPLVRRQPGVNGLAIASFVCSLVWGYGLLSVVAIVLSVMARKQIRSYNEVESLHQPGDGFAIAGLVIGIIGAVVTAIVILALLAASGHGAFVAAAVCIAVVCGFGYVVTRYGS